MAQFLVTTPNPQYSGRLGEVVFADGRAVMDEDTHAAELAYARSHYTVEPHEAEPEEPDAPVDARPRNSASKADWVAYAVEHGMEAAEAEALTRDELVAHFPKEN